MASTYCLIDHLPDSILARIIGRAVATTFEQPERFNSKPYVHLSAASDFAELSKLRSVCSRFNRLASDVEELVCFLDDAPAVDAHLIWFLRKMDNLRALYLVYNDPEDYEDSHPLFSSGFLAGAMCFAPRLERLCLRNGNLLGLNNPLDVLELLLTSCPRLECLIFEYCHFSFNRPINKLSASLKELHLSIIQSTDDSSLASLVQAAPNLEKLSLHIDGERCLDLVTRLSSTTLKHLFLDYRMVSLEVEEDIRMMELGPVEINAPFLVSLHLRPDGDRKMKIDAPELTSLDLYSEYPGPFVLPRSWKLRRLAANESFDEDELLRLLMHSRDLEVADFRYLDFRGEQHTMASILTCLANVKELSISAKTLLDLSCSVEGKAFPVVENLLVLTADAWDSEQVGTCLELVKVSPKLMHLRFRCVFGAFGFETREGTKRASQRFFDLKDKMPWLSIIEIAP